MGWNDGTVANVERALSDLAPAFRRTGQLRWDSSWHGKMIIAHVTGAGLEWLELRAEVPEHWCRLSAWALLEVNGRLREGPRAVPAHAGAEGAMLCADIYLGDISPREVDAPHLGDRIVRTVGALDRAGDAETEPVQPPEATPAEADRLKGVCAEVGWSSTQTAGGAVRLTCSEQPGVAVMAIPAGGGLWRVEVPILLHRLTPRCREAIARFLLEACAVRHGVAAAARTGQEADDVFVRVTEALDVGAPASIARVLSMAGAASDAVRREAGALADESLAEDYLALRWRTPGAGTGERAIPAGTEELTCQQRQS